ncbi:glycerophosphodiester phosphodiesterase [Candidatus Aerophobetes bacterium]|uniref:Glycerophosphodiester phosphodiesterase n=1 Tax=Aerophobetes bacterium TaxID=2030807 RepID=A0A662DIA5_UNCAE|nr:MAG: glycerophosphodiester phosphodiesterase [Candidatus Aerophobetes bacterium]
MRRKVFNIAHRGARSLAPENTISAARKALEVGADGWELDVQMSRDKKMVVIHDESLVRTSNVKEIFPHREPWLVRDFTLKELQELDFGSWFNETDPFGQIAAGNVSKEEQRSFVGVKILSLEEALEFTKKSKWKVNIEIKSFPFETDNFELVEKVVDQINQFKMEKMVMVSSFNHAYIKQVKKLNPRITTGALVDKPLNNPANYLKEIEADVYDVSVSAISLDEIELLQSKGFSVIIWTVNDEKTMKDLIKVRVDGVITDFPQKLKTILDPGPRQ